MIVYDEDGLTLHQADVLDGLAALADGSVQTCVTSPPYWGLRDYGTAEWIGGDAACEHKRPVAARTARPAGLLSGSKEYVAQQEMSGPACPCGATRQDSGIGLEPTPDLYVERMVAVFREVRRVLRDDGTLWLNLGDSYATSPTGSYGTKSGLNGAQTSERYKQTIREQYTKRKDTIVSGYKPKDLIGIPWLVAFALQRDGWYLRSDIIWSKPNPMPESVRDRPTKSHEYIFLLSKSARYYFDQDAVREPAQDRPQPASAAKSISPNGHTPWMDNRYAPGPSGFGHNPAGRNIRSVWTMATQPSPLPHFAAFPEELAERCIKAGTSERGCCAECGAPLKRVTETTLAGERRIQRGARPAADERGVSPTSMLRTNGRTFREVETKEWAWTCNHKQPILPCVVLDPFCGTGTTLKVARDLGRKGVGIELSEKYCDLAVTRLLYGTKGAVAVSKGQESLWAK